jgi:hypothetical protein
MKPTTSATHLSKRTRHQPRRSCQGERSCVLRQQLDNTKRLVGSRPERVDVAHAKPDQEFPARLGAPLVEAPQRSARRSSSRTANACLRPRTTPKKWAPGRHKGCGDVGLLPRVRGASSEDETGSRRRGLVRASVSHCGNGSGLGMGRTTATGVWRNVRRHGRSSEEGSTAVIGAGALRPFAQRIWHPCPRHRRDSRRLARLQWSRAFL